MAKLNFNEQQLEYIRFNIGKKQLTRMAKDLNCTVSILERNARNAGINIKTRRKYIKKDKIVLKGEFFKHDLNIATI